MKRVIVKGLTAASLLALATGVAEAATVTNTFNVTANVQAKCLFVAGSIADLAFGEYDPTAPADLDTDTSFSARCTRGVGYEIGLNDGGNFDSGTRRMEADGEYLEYKLYRDAGRTQEWRDIGSGNTITGTAASSAPFATTIYGRIPGSADAPAGDYTDSVTITIAY